MIQNSKDKVFLFLFICAGFLLLLLSLPPVTDYIMGILLSFTSDAEFNVIHWKNILNLYILKYLFVDILLILFVYVKYKNHVPLKDSFETFTDFVNRMSRPTQVLLAFVLILIFHSFVSLDTFDDEWFKAQVQEKGILPFISDRYFTWTSRFLIELFMLGTFTVNDGIWRLLDSIAFVVVAESIISLTVPENKKRYSYVVYIMLLFIPILSLSSCGWGAVTCNYLWPCAEIMPVFVIMKKVFCKVKIPAWQFVLSLLPAVFACNQEQMAALVFGITLFLLVYRLFAMERSLRDNWYFLVVLLISAASLLFILTCPGNVGRYGVEVQEDFPEYDSISVFTKLLMSVPLIFSFFLGISVPNIVIIPLLAAVTFTAFRKKSRRIRILAVVLDLFVFVFGYCGFVLRRFVPGFVFQNNCIYPYGGVSLVVSAVEIAVFTIMAVLLAISVFMCSRDRKHAFLNLLLLAAGYCSSAIIAFSPTVYEAHWGRPFLFTFIIIFYITSDLFVSNYTPEGKK